MQKPHLNLRCPLRVLAAGIRVSAGLAGLPQLPDLSSDPEKQLDRHDHGDNP